MNKVRDWYSVSLGQFIQLQELVKIEDDTERIVAIAELLWGPEVSELPLVEFNAYVRGLDFLKTEMPHRDTAPKKLVLNGRKYYTDCLLGNISTAQYVDFTNHNNAEATMDKVLSVFIIPEGHKYNDGYDMQEVINDIASMPVPTAASIAFFFGRQFSTFMRIFQSYSTRQIEETDLPKEAKERLIEATKLSVDLALYPLSSNSAK